MFFSLDQITPEGEIHGAHYMLYKTMLKKEATVRLYGDRITVDDMVFPFEKDAVVILGKNKINLYHENDLYQLKGSKRFNGLKYLNFSFRYKNQAGGQHGEFLGL